MAKKKTCRVCLMLRFIALFGVVVAIFVVNGLFKFFS